MADGPLRTKNIREIVGGLTQARVQVAAVEVLICEEMGELAEQGVPPERGDQVRCGNHRRVLREVFEVLGKIRGEFSPCVSIETKKGKQ